MRCEGLGIWGFGGYSCPNCPLPFNCLLPTAYCLLSTVYKKDVEMSVSQWGIVVGVVTSALLAVGPWVFMVHAKLAVIAAQIADLDEKLEKATEANQQLWSLYARHEARLGTHDVQLSHVAERLQEL